MTAVYHFLFCANAQSSSRESGPLGHRNSFSSSRDLLRPARARPPWATEILEMHVPTLIEQKREGKALTDEEISHLVSGFMSGEIADYQMSAWAMAVFFQGMTPAETQHLTKAMMESGRVLEYPDGTPPKVDKHSTGGIGDKVSLVLAPLLACDEVWVPMICGRGLGITGGTLDKLESIPGFNVQIDERRALAQLESIGVFVIGQTADICPADRKLYALRDVTGTIPSQPLIVASIMSKKLAENLDRLVLDVKFGSGAFMKMRKEAKQLAASMTKVGRLMGVKVSHLLSPMDEPLGRSVGNALEVAECVQILQGGGPSDVVALVLDLAEQVSTASRAKLARWLSDGTAWRKFISLVYAQDGDASSLEKITEVHRAPIIQPLLAQSAGIVGKMDAETIGRASLFLGGGRQKVDDTIDFAVGLSGIKKIGERVEAQEPLLFVHARDDQALLSVLPLLEKAIEIS
jgi:pyrimidine-nucleoside phosphorylase